MLIITGLGRCGTSFMMLLLKELGFKVGKSLNYDKSINAGMELAPAYSISRDLYDEFIKKGKQIELNKVISSPYWGNISFRNQIMMLETIRREGGVEVFKDPRITWHPRIIRTWKMMYPDLKLIIMHRKIEDIVASRKRSTKDPKRGEDLNQYKVDFADFYTEVLKLDIPHVNLFYPNFFLYKGIYLQDVILNKINLDIGKYLKKETKYEDLLTIWDKIYDKNKVFDFNERNKK